MSDATPVLDHKDSEFTPLDHSELNDFRRKIVEGEEVTDEELRHSIQTFLFFDRQLQMQGATKSKKAPTKKRETIAEAEKAVEGMSLDDLLDSPVK